MLKFSIAFLFLISISISCTVEIPERTNPVDPASVGDHDGDGIIDALDPDPFDPEVTGDDDEDGVDNLVDNCPDDENPSQVDTDNDGEGDACDSDIDGDGHNNEEDVDPLDATEWTDNDGVPDNTDNCLGLNNPNQLDTDNDGEGDACDEDKDGDGHNNNEDADPLDNKEWTDTDGVPDATDNCLGVNNENQADADEDGAGDACDETYNPPFQISVYHLSSGAGVSTDNANWQLRHQVGGPPFAGASTDGQFQIRSFFPKGDMP